MCILLGDRRLVQSTRKSRECVTHHTKPALEDFRVCFRKLTDGANAVTAEFALCGIAHIQKVTHRQRVDNLLIIIRLDDRYGIRLFIIAAEFCGDFIKRNANRNGDSQLPFNAVADFFGNFYRVPEQAQTARNVQPRLIQAETLHLVGVVTEYLAHIAAVLLVFAVAGGNHDQVAAMLLCLPDGHCRFHAHPLGGIACGENDTVPRLRVAAHGDALSAQLRVFLHFYACVKAVAIAMQYMPLSHIVPTSCTPIVTPQCFTVKCILHGYKRKSV